MKSLNKIFLIFCALCAFSSSALAHHGTAAIGVAGPEGPGAAIETTSAILLPPSSALAMLKSEFASFRQFAFAAPQNKQYNLFNTMVIGAGITPYLSAFLFQPYNLKSQDEVGTNKGLGDLNLMLSLGFKYDEGLRLIPEKESLDEMRDWHFSFWASTTFPFGPTEHLDSHGEYYAPDMQTGFGTFSPALGLAALKQLSDSFTWLAEANYQYFFAHEYSFTKYQFGAETRLGSALVYRLWGHKKMRADLSAELNMLNLQRDREQNSLGEMMPLSASGGTILYASLGGRFSLGAVSLSLGVKRAALKTLNEGEEQQGAEGLENARVSLSISCFSQF